MKRFPEAEKMFEKILEYLPVWPGFDDSDYPIDLRSIGLARMAQENWKGAEEPLQKAIAILDTQIEKDVHSDADFVRNEMANDLRMSQDSALNFLAVTYFREQRAKDALPLLERAYNQVVKYKAPPTIAKQIVDNGVAVSVAIGDDNLRKTWSERARTYN
jgi:tetratricopeptide (TPR) repeat protein